MAENKITRTMLGARWIAVFSVVACSTGPDAPTGPTRDPWLDCDVIATRCHERYMDSAKALECHDLGHDPMGHPEKCTMKLAECLVACPVTDGGRQVDASSDASSGAGGSGVGGQGGAGGQSTGGQGGAGPGAGGSGGNGSGSGGQGGTGPGTGGRGGGAGSGGAAGQSGGGQGGSLDAGRDVGSDGPARDAMGEAGPANDCKAYCDCMQPTCGTQTGYPFATAAACTTACMMHTAAEHKCYLYFCNEAKRTGSKGHNCQHAWGMFGLDECPP